MTTNRFVRGDAQTVRIGNVRPELGGGRFPMKSGVGGQFTVTADVLCEGHEALAAGLSPLYGIYSGYKLCENAAIPGTEEYQDSEKYEIKVRDWDGPGNLKDYIARVNRICRENPALQEYRNLRFYASDDDNVLFFGKRNSDGGNAILAAANLDPFEPHQAQVQVPLMELGIGADERSQVHKLITDERHLWKGPVQTIRLDPREEPAAIFRISRFPHKNYGTPCY